MKALRSVLLLFILLLPASILSREQAATQDSRGFFWEIGDGPGQVYLLGSVHLLSADNYPLPAKMEEAFQAADVLVMEMDLREGMNLEIMTQIMQIGTYQDGRTLRDDLTPQTYATLEEVLAARGIHLALFNHYKPWYLNMTVSLLWMNQAGLQQEYGLEFYFFRKALQAPGKTIKGLETLEDQISALSSLSQQDQEQMIRDWIVELDTMESFLHDLVERWQSGDDAWLVENVLEPMKKNPEIYERLIVHRNRKWIPDIESFLQDGRNYLVLVGTGHLVGDDSVIVLLEQKGISCRRR